MKKTILLALAITLSAALTPACADKKKEKKKQQQVSAVAVEQPISLLTPRDSLSYAAGYAAADGLLDYLQRQYEVTEELMPAFIEGFKASLGRSADAEYRARQAGASVADLFEQRILPEITGTFAGTSDSIDTRIFTQAFLASVQRDTTVFNRQTAAQLSGARTTAARAEKEQAYRAENVRWLEDNSQRPGVVTTESGLQYKVITQGTGPVPTSADRVTVKYEGRLIDGTVFDSSYQRDPQTTTFGVGQVIKGWTEALCMMPVGSKWELYIPQELAYGARQQGRDIKPYSTLVFTVELVAIADK